MLRHSDGDTQAACLSTAALFKFLEPYTCVVIRRYSRQSQQSASETVVHLYLACVQEQ